MIGIHISSNAEWSSVLALCGDPECGHSPYGEYFLYQFPFWKENALVYFSGYSKEKAAGAVQYMICRFDLSQVIVAGSCGGVAEDLSLLEVVIGSETLIYDCIDRLVFETELFPTDFRTKLDLSWIEGKVLPERTRIGKIATADQDIDFSVRELLRPEQIEVADWESGAVAIVCRLNKVPLIVFRGVSDLPIEGLSQEEQSQQYLENTPKLMKRIFELYLPLVGAV